MANDDSATIEALTNKLAEAFNAGDFAAVGAMYANDAVICPPNSNIVTGKGNIQSFWERKRMIQGMSFESISIKPLGESAFRTVGTLSLKVGRQNAGPRAAAAPQNAINAKYVFVWQKIGDEWKIESSIWNRIGPARTAGLPAPAALRAGGMGPGGGPRGAGQGPHGGPRGSGLGPGGGPRGVGGPGGGPRAAGMGPGGGQRGGMGPGGGPRGGGAGPGAGGQRGMGPGGGRRDGGPGGGPRGGPGGEPGA